MGYEVLDSDGTTSARARSPLAPSEIVSLQDLPEPADVGPRRPGDEPRRPRFTKATMAHGRPATVAIVAGVAIVGLVLGATWMNRHRTQVEQAASRSQVTAFAMVANVDALVTGQGRVADFAVLVFNLGELPLTVPTSAADARASIAEPEIGLITGNGAIGPGEDALIRARVPIDCDSSTPITFALPVKSADGTTHRLDLHDSAEHMLATTTGQQLCSRFDGREQVSAELVGTLDRPMLRLQNTTDMPLHIEFDQSWTQISGPTGLSLTTEPALPLTLRPRQAAQVHLRITAAKCVRDLAELNSSIGGYGYLTVVSSVEGTDQQTGTGVDLTALIGLAIARACA